MYKSIPFNFMFFKAPLLKRILGYVGIIYVDYRIDEKRPIYYGDRILVLKYNIPIRFEDICIHNEKLAYDILIGYIKKKDFSTFQLAMAELYDDLNSYKLHGYPSYKTSCEKFMKLVNSINIRKELIHYDENKSIIV